MGVSPRSITWQEFVGLWSSRSEDDPINLIRVVDFSDKRSDWPRTTWGWWPEDKAHRYASLFIVNGLETGRKGTNHTAWMLSCCRTPEERLGVIVMALAHDMNARGSSWPEAWRGQHGTGAWIQDLSRAAYVSLFRDVEWFYDWHHAQTQALPTDRYEFEKKPFTDPLEFIDFLRLQILEVATSLIVARVNVLAAHGPRASS